MTTLIVIDQAPYGSWSGREALDMAFSLAAFDQPVSLLFCDAGVNWLRQGQQATELGQKTVEKNLAAAPMFGVEAILADGPACQRYGLDDSNLLAGVTRVEAVEPIIACHTDVLFAG